MTLRSVRRSVLVTAAAGTAGALAAVALVPSAMATGVADAEKKVEELGREVEVAAERYNEARAQIGPLQQQLTVAQTREADQQRLVETLQVDMRDFAISAFKQGGVDPSLAVLMSEDPVALVENGAAVEALSRRQAATLDDYGDALEQLAADRQATDAKLAEITALEQQLAATRTDIEARLAGAEDELRAAERARAERAAAAVAASRAGTSTAGGTAAAAVAPTGTPVGVSCADVGVTAPNARAAAVLEYACAQLGKPYRWAASGPNSFDCSGFTMASYAAAGVSLPHSSRSQYANYPKVDRASLQPGDLVFSYSPISHVGIYLGNGMIIHSPRTGDVVKISQLGYNGSYSGASRP